MDDDDEAASSSPAANTFGAAAVQAATAAIASAMPTRFAGRRRNRGERACSGNTFIVTSFDEAGSAGGHPAGASRVPRTVRRTGLRRPDQTPFHPTRCNFFGASSGRFTRKTPGMAIAEGVRNGAHRRGLRHREQHHAKNRVDQ
ncbi:hypothetical protein [Burkholderia sp. IMCC1007]|uniref:hypothetical protein n=1 Tax=Burkholderia sp. IMCC1007 TaxID=3004104 RepID=UPI0022B2D9D4|nr:hypothetical protein [Burkholderia sp. IMCC1007]